MDLLLIITILASIILAFGIGSNDETFSPVVGAGTLSVRKATILGGILAIIGTIFLSGNVGKTLGTGLLRGSIEPDYDLFMLLSIVLATAVLLIIGSSLGLPLSTTHIVVAAVIGIAISYAARTPTNDIFTDYLNPATFIEVLLSWVISPALGYVGAWGTYLLMRKFVYTRIKGLDDVDRSERLASFALLGTVIVTQLSRGGNDAAKATSILYWLAADGAISTLELDLFVVFAAVMMGVGLFVLGRRLLRRVGTSIIYLQPTSAFSLQVFVAITLTLCTIWGLPVSGTHILIFAMLGVLRAQEEAMSAQQRKSLYRMLLGWGLTFPLGAAISAGIYNLFLFLS